VNVGISSREARKSRESAPEGGSKTEAPVEESVENTE
jgi:hypothetical protein